MKKIENISFQQINSIPQLIKDFLNNKHDFFAPALFENHKVNAKIAEKKNHFSESKRKLLFDVLKEQNATISISEKQNRNQDALLSENTFTVTTGHQLNLFTGPVFFVYKILQTIKLAEDLQKNFPESQFVPIFWMATEDHDFEEINHFRTENDYFEIKANSGGAVGRIQVEDQYFINQFEEVFKDFVFGTELILMMKNAYKKGNTLAEATRILVNEIFSEFGLLIIDGDHPNLKAEMKSIFRAELLEEKLFHSTKEKIEFLKSNYGKVQVNPREINLFYLTETRNRIQKQNNEFFVVDTSQKFSEEEILSELEKFPERFSPNAVLRPAFQENILPNIAYIGGNAEIMYWLELVDYFSEIQLPFPFLIPRNSMLMVEEKTVAKVEKFGLSWLDLLQNFAELSKNFLVTNHLIQQKIEQKEEVLKIQFEELKSISESTDITFGNLVKAEETRQLKSFERMKKRLLRAEKVKQQEKLHQLERLFLKIHPSGIWQERIFNFSVFYADNGKDWLQNCYREMSSENSDLIIFSI